MSYGTQWHSDSLFTCARQSVFSSELYLQTHHSRSVCLKPWALWRTWPGPACRNVQRSPPRSDNKPAATSSGLEPEPPAALRSKCTTWSPTFLHSANPGTQRTASYKPSRGIQRPQRYLLLSRVSLSSESPQNSFHFLNIDGSPRTRKRIPGVNLFGRTRHASDSCWKIRLWEMTTALKAVEGWTPSYSRSGAGEEITPAGRVRVRVWCVTVPLFPVCCCVSRKLWRTCIRRGTWK